MPITIHRGYIGAFTQRNWPGKKCGSGDTWIKKSQQRDWSSLGASNAIFISTNTSEDPGQPLKLPEKGNDIIKIKLQELEE